MSSSIRQRKVVQISAVDNTIYALCDDGGIWCWYRWQDTIPITYTWKQITPIPQPDSEMKT